MTEHIVEAYLHCKQCITEDKPSDIDVTTNGTHVQIWCNVHDIEVATLRLVTPLSTECQGEDHD